LRYFIDEKEAGKYPQKEVIIVANILVVQSKLTACSINEVDFQLEYLYPKNF